MVRIFMISKLESIQLQSFDEYRFYFIKSTGLNHTFYGMMYIALFNIVFPATYIKLKIYVMQ